MPRTIAAQISDAETRVRPRQAAVHVALVKLCDASGTQLRTSRRLRLLLTHKAMCGLRMLIDGRAASGASVARQRGADAINDLLEACADAYTSK